MLKFQNNNTIIIATFEDFILTAFVIIDELYFRYVSDAVSKRRNVLNAKLSDSEIITISICGELIGVDIYFPELAAKVALTEPRDLFFK